MDNFRLFVGIPLSDRVTAALSALVSRMQASLPFRRWTHPADFHVTLHFLGETPAARMDAVRGAIAEAAAYAEPPIMTLATPGVFGTPDSPRVLWNGVGEIAAPGRLASLHEALASKLAAAGFELEKRPFRAHVTLARQGGPDCGREAIREAWVSALEAEGISTEDEGVLSWRADSVVLFRSHLGRRPSYERLQQFPLAAVAEPILRGMPRKDLSNLAK